MAERQLALLLGLRSAALRGDLAELAQLGEALSQLEIDGEMTQAQMRDLQVAAAQALSLMQAARSGVAASRMILENHRLGDGLFTYGRDGRLQRLSPPSQVVLRL